MLRVPTRELNAGGVHVAMIQVGTGRVFLNLERRRRRVVIQDGGRGQSSQGVRGPRWTDVVHAAVDLTIPAASLRLATRRGRVPLDVEGGDEAFTPSRSTSVSGKERRLLGLGSSRSSMTSRFALTERDARQTRTKQSGRRRLLLRLWLSDGRSLPEPKPSCSAHREPRVLLVHEAAAHLISDVEMAWMLIPSAARELEHLRRDARVHAQETDRDLHDVLVVADLGGAELLADLLDPRTGALEVGLRERERRRRRGRSRRWSRSG